MKSKRAKVQNVSRLSRRQRVPPRPEEVDLLEVAYRDIDGYEEPRGRQFRDMAVGSK